MKLKIGEKIALLRKEKEITQTELADYLFLAPQTISRWEVGSGAPEITLLPKIATFFGVSIDELFGLTSLERTEDLVAKYSVMRDSRSFQEAMEYIDSQLQSIDAVQKNSWGDGGELERDRDQLEAEKTHMWIQLGREAFQRALEIAERFVEKTEGNPEHPWYLRMRLQRDQLWGETGKGREVLAERKKDFMDQPNGTSLLRYLSVLDHRQDYEAILELAKGEAQAYLFPPAKENLSLWRACICAAAQTGEKDFIRQYLPPVLKVCAGEDELDFLMCLAEAYQGEEREAIRERARALLPEAGLNEYFEEKIREKLEGETREEKREG